MLKPYHASSKSILSISKVFNTKRQRGRKSEREREKDRGRKERGRERKRFKEKEIARNHLRLPRGYKTGRH